MRFRSFAFLQGLWRAFFAGAVALSAPVVLAPVPAFARGAPESFADLASQLLPTVVNIATSQTLKGTPGPKLDLPPGSPLEDLFKDFNGPGRSLPKHVTSLGSGFVIDKDGFIVTNNHVIADADEITVTLNDGRSYPARLIGRDEKTDLALLKIRPPKPIPATHFGDSDHARVGDWVIAIGNPFGLGSTVTAGIVSARNRDIAAGPYDDFIQTDAPINRGNSGGPLFDMDGNVVGVNSAIFSPSGGSVGIAFSIPSNLVKEVVYQLKAYGETRRGWLGVRVQQVTDDIAEGLGLPGAKGALVADITNGGPAAKAGVQNGDVIVGFNGKPVPDSRALPRIVADTGVGKVVPMEVLRKGQKVMLKVAVGRLPEDKPKKIAQKTNSQQPGKTKSQLSQLGLSLGALDGMARAKYKIGNAVQGVLITDVDPDSVAGENNLRAGDVIQEVQHQPVRSPQDVATRIAADAKAGRKVELLQISRAGETVFVALKIAGSS